MTPIQAEFFAAEIPQRQHWNQSLLLQPRTPLRPDALAEALAALVRHHDALRLRYEQSDGIWRQAYAEPVTDSPEALLWVRQVADRAELEALAEAAQRSLNLTEGPLLRAVLFRYPDGGQRLLLAIHHLVVDGVSWRILLEDLKAAYEALCQGRPAGLPPKTGSFQDWAERLRAYAQSKALQAEAKFWPVSYTHLTLPTKA